jgi:hypothetical protein
MLNPFQAPGNTIMDILSQAAGSYSQCVQRYSEPFGERLPILDFLPPLPFIIPDYQVAFFFRQAP